MVCILRAQVKFWLGFFVERNILTDIKIVLFHSVCAVEVITEQREGFTRWISEIPLSFNAFPGIECFIYYFQKSGLFLFISSKLSVTEVDVLQFVIASTVIKFFELRCILHSIPLQNGD